MACIHSNYTNINPNGISISSSEASHKYINFRKHSLSVRINGEIKKMMRTSTSIFKREKGSFVHCCTSVSPFSTEEVEGLNGNSGDEEGQFGYFVKEHGWKVRRMAEDESEIREVAYIQSQAFYEPAAIFNDFFFEIFQAEVLSGLLYRLRNSPPDRYACLVAEPNTEATNDVSPNSELVGVVDVTVLKDNAVLQHLPGQDEEYLYVSGIAVLNNFRRQKVATALLKGCDRVSNTWGFQHLVLRAYEDDMGALKLYTNAGYHVVSRDPPWFTTWIGRRRRVLMVKHPFNHLPKTSYDT